MTDTSVLVSKSPRKFKSLLRELLLPLNFPSSPSEEVIGVTRSVTCILFPVKLQVRLVPLESSLCLLLVVLVLSVLPSPRSSFNSLVLMMSTHQPLVTLELPRTSSELLSKLLAKPTDILPLISGPRLRALPHLSQPLPNNSKNMLPNPLDVKVVIVDVVDVVAVVVAVVEIVVAVVVVVAIVVIVVAVVAIVMVAVDAENKEENERRGFEQMDCPVQLF